MSTRLEKSSFAKCFYFYFPKSDELEMKTNELFSLANGSSSFVD